jgi:hypothetical protein
VVVGCRSRDCSLCSKMLYRAYRNTKTRSDVEVSVSSRRLRSRKGGGGNMGLIWGRHSGITVGLLFPAVGAVYRVHAQRKSSEMGLAPEISRSIG